MNYIEAISKRRSVRTFDKNKKLSDELLQEINEFILKQTNPFNLKIEWKILNKDEYDLSSPVIVGEDYYILGKIKKAPFAEEAFGYEFEEIVLFLTTKNLGTTWMAGTLPREVFEKAIDLKNGEVMPCVSPIGFINKKMSLREKLMRKGIKADTRLNFNDLFFSKDFNTSLSGDELNKFKDILELVRIAPSAVNKQPWRILIDGNNIHFYKASSKGFKGEGLDIQKVDIGIAMNHFVQGLKNQNIDYEFKIEKPNIESFDLEYIATIILK